MHAEFPPLKSLHLYHIAFNSSVTRDSVDNLTCCSGSPDLAVLAIIHSLNARDADSTNHHRVTWMLSCVLDFVIQHEFLPAVCTILSKNLEGIQDSLLDKLSICADLLLHDEDEDNITHFKQLCSILPDKLLFETVRQLAFGKN